MVYTSVTTTKPATQCSAWQAGLPSYSHVFSGNFQFGQSDTTAAAGCWWHAFIFIPKTSDFIVEVTWCLSHCLQTEWVSEWTNPNPNTQWFKKRHAPHVKFQLLFVFNTWSVCFEVCPSVKVLLCNKRANVSTEPIIRPHTAGTLSGNNILYMYVFIALQFNFGSTHHNHKSHQILSGNVSNPKMHGGAHRPHALKQTTQRYTRNYQLTLPEDKHPDADLWKRKLPVLQRRGCRFCCCFMQRGVWRHFTK